ncbi:MAG TPA: ABC transporter permease, partial [Myxococcaceae bacterium]|nr:ABC transporter permease [Myxococcaceae bacterium]
MTLFRIAARNLLRNRRRTLLSLAGIAIGVASMVAFRGLIIGQREMMLANLVQGLSGAVQIHRTGYVANVQGLPISLDFADSEALRQRIRSVDGVLQLAPRITFGAMLSLPDQIPPGGDPSQAVPGKSGFFVATAIDPLLEPEVTPRRFDWLKRGRLFKPGERAVVLNEDFARSLGIAPAETAAPASAVPSAASAAPGDLPPPGQTVDERRADEDERQWPGLVAADKDGAPNGEAVALTGVFTQGAPGDRKNGLVPLDLAQRLLRMEGRVTEYAVAVRSLDDAHAVRDRLRAALGPEFEVHAWDDLLPFFRDMMRLQDVVLGLIAFVVLVTVLLVIANSMLMNVLERVREI